MNEFRILPDPQPADFELFKPLSTHTPFHTEAYAQARKNNGNEVYWVGEWRGSECRTGALALLRRGRMSRHLEVVTTPQPEDPVAFWDGFLSACRSLRITQASLETFSSLPGAGAPRLAGELSRSIRHEHIVDLDDDWESRLSKGHRYSLKLAARNALVVTRTHSRSALTEHIRIMEASMARRQNRGEGLDGKISAKFMSCLLDARSGELFQVHKDGEIVSSVMVVSSEAIAYEYTAGSTPEGMKMGASTFALVTIGRMLLASGVRKFNLGGAGEDNPGLLQFKQNFGARPTQVESVGISLVSPLKRSVLNTARKMRDNSRKVLAFLSKTAS